MILKLCLLPYTSAEIQSFWWLLGKCLLIPKKSFQAEAPGRDFDRKTTFRKPPVTMTTQVQKADHEMYRGRRYEVCLRWIFKTCKYFYRRNKT
jgi:hypothetical protein